LIPGPERRRYSGELRGFEDGNILIDIDGELQLVALDLLDWGHLVLDLDEFSSLQATLAADEKLEGAQS
jgi:hypothetical protein